MRAAACGSWRRSTPSRCRPSSATTTATRRAFSPSASAARALGAFAARCAALAAENPYAWFRDGKSAAELATVTPENRMIGFPYPKFMNSILDVNQGAALLLAADSTGRSLGVPEDRWIYPWAGVDVTERWSLLDRVDYHSLPGARRAGAALRQTADLTIDRGKHLG